MGVRNEMKRVALGRVVRRRRKARAKKRTKIFRVNCMGLGESSIGITLMLKS